MLIEDEGTWQIVAKAFSRTPLRLFRRPDGAPWP